MKFFKHLYHYYDDDDDDNDDDDSMTIHIVLS